MGEPLLITVKRYQCPHCSRSRSKRTATVEHIARCWHNPANRTCKTCVHLDDYPGGPPCFPGRDCDCNAPSVDCAAGVQLEVGDVVTGCPEWKAF